MCVCQIRAELHIFWCQTLFIVWHRVNLKYSISFHNAGCAVRLAFRRLGVRSWGPVIYFYAPNFEEVDGAYWFWVVRASVCPSVHSSRVVHARVLKFHIWILHGKIADPYFFSCTSYLLLWSYAPLKNQNEILSARYLEKYYYLIKLKKRNRLIFLFFRSYGPLKILAFKLVSNISQKLFELGAWNLVSW